MKELAREFYSSQGGMGSDRFGSLVAAKTRVEERLLLAYRHMVTTTL